jgi:hypothetical protein
MDSKIKYQEKQNKLLIEIQPDPKGIVMFGMLFFYVMPFAIFIILAFVIIANNRFKIDSDLFLPLGMIIGSFILIRVFLKKTFEKEVIVIDKDYLILCKRFLVDKNKRLIRKNEIKDLRYVGREEFTNHPLEPKGFDYLGIGTGEKEVQWFSESGNLAFFYNGSIFRFGKNIWEEDGLELIEKLKKYGCQQRI